MVAELKKALADAAALRAALANLSGQVERQVEREFVRRNAEGRLLWLPDHACQRCVPNSDILIPGFECDRHRALTVLAAAHPGEGWASPSEVEALKAERQDAVAYVTGERDAALARVKEVITQGKQFEMDARAHFDQSMTNKRERDQALRERDQALGALAALRSACEPFVREVTLVDDDTSYVEDAWPDHLGPYLTAEDVVDGIRGLITAAPSTAGWVSPEEHAKALKAWTDERAKRLERIFPIQGGPAIPWTLIEGCERQALANHGQSLDVLASRGGLGPDEAVAVIEGRRWVRMEAAAANARLRELAGWVSRETLETVAWEAWEKGRLSSTGVGKLDMAQRDADVAAILGETP